MVKDFLFRLAERKFCASILKETGELKERTFRETLINDTVVELHFRSPSGSAMIVVSS